MTKGDGADPEMAAVAAVADVVRGAGGVFAGVRHAKLAGEGEEQVNQQRGGEDDSCQARQWSRSDKEMQHKNQAAARQERLDEQVER